MKSYLYNSGAALLTAQDGQAYKLQFTGFKVCSDAAFTFNAAVNTLPGTITFNGSINEMSYVPLSGDEVIIECKVDHDISQRQLAAVQLLVDDTPFCVCIPENAFTKLGTIEDQAVGSKFFLRIQLNIPGLYARMSFANLKSTTSVFKPVATEQAMPMYPWEEKVDQLVIQKHSKTNNLVFVLNAWGDFWGCPLSMKMDDANFWHVDGGVAGDGHKYTG